MRGLIVFLMTALKAAFKSMKLQHPSRENKLIHNSLTKEFPTITSLMKISHFPNVLHFRVMIKGIISLKSVLAEHSWEILAKKTSRDGAKIRLFLSLFQKAEIYWFSISATKTNPESNVHLK